MARHPRTMLAAVALASMTLTPAFAQEPAPASAGAPRPPIPNRLDDTLPPWLRVRGEFRERLEGSKGPRFGGSHDDAYWLSRLRLGAVVAPSPALSFHAQVQDARVAGKTVGVTGPPFRAPLDLRLGFAEIGPARSRVAVRVGRQELAYGEQRLVGHASWLNAARVFDGVKLTLRSRTATTDVFAASVVRTLPDAFDRSGAGNRFAGAYLSTAALVPLATVEPYLFHRRDVALRSEAGAIADLRLATLGVRLSGRLPARLDYGVELALQRGSLGPDDVRAWAGHWQLRQTLPGRATVRLTGEYNHASGDRDPADGIRGTFDQLYPTPHDKYGLADQIGWKNLHHARAGVEITPLAGTPVAANYHSWWLAEPRDAVYSAGGAPAARVAAGAPDRHIGQEIDVQVARPITRHAQFAAGYAHIFTGAFLRRATPGASYSHPYVMVTYVFLADR